MTSSMLLVYKFKLWDHKKLLIVWPFFLIYSPLWRKCCHAYEKIQRCKNRIVKQIFNLRSPLLRKKSHSHEDERIHKYFFFFFYFQVFNNYVWCIKSLKYVRCAWGGSMLEEKGKKTSIIRSLTPLENE